MERATTSVPRRGAVLFDIDGTILRAGDRWHARAFEYALKEVFDEPLSLDGVPLAGMLDSQIARLALHQQGMRPEEVDPYLDRLMSLMGQRYRETIADQERESWLLPGVVELAEQLQHEYLIGVLTGNAKSVARAKLEASGVDELFPWGAYGDTATERFQLVETALAVIQQETQTTIPAGQAVLIGDTPRDIEAARASGARVIAVATGRFSVEDLVSHGPDVVVEDLSDSVKLVAQINDLLDASPGRNGSSRR